MVSRDVSVEIALKPERGLYVLGGLHERGHSVVGVQDPVKQFAFCL